MKNIFDSHPLFAEINTCANNNEFQDVYRELEDDEVKICDMDDLLKAVQTIMVSKRHEANELNDKVLFEPDEANALMAAKRFNQVGSEAEFLKYLRMYLMYESARQHGNELLGKEAFIRKGFIIAVKQSALQN